MIYEKSEKLNEVDAKKLDKAKTLIESTDIWKNFACEDPDYNLFQAVNGIEETLNKNWWV